jgi:nucleoid-associated protein YgaU
MLLSFSQAYGQTNKGDDFDNIELSQEQWEAVRDTFAIYAIKHLARLDTLQLQIDSLKQVNAQWEARDCEAELYALVGATKDEVADFRLKFNETESRINTKTSSPDDVRRMYLDEVKSSKIRCLPEFSERYSAMINTFSSFASNENTSLQNTLITTNTNSGTYLVVKGDYLWLVAQKNYNNPNLWPAIWEANKFGTANPGYFYYLSYDQVSNPNLIYPGQVLKIPVLTEGEKKEIEEKSHRYKKFRRILPQN